MVQIYICLRYLGTYIINVYYVPFEFILIYARLLSREFACRNLVYHEITYEIFFKIYFT